MPILALDKNGKIYATSPDRADGRGYGSAPECVEEGDLTLGSAYLKSQAHQRNEQMNRHRAQVLADRQEEADRYTQQMGKAQERRREYVEAKMLENPKLQDSLVKRAVSANYGNTTPTGMNGNGLSANGQSGWHGMSRDQKTIHHALSGVGANTAHHVDRVEAEQARQRTEAARILRLSARR